MDPQQVEELGRFLQARAADLERVVSDIDAKVRSTSWQGTDADQFRTQWWPAHRSKISAAAGSVQGLGQSALNNAAEQVRASQGEAGVVSGPGGLPTLDPSQIGTNDWGLDDKLEALLGSTKDLEFIRSTYGLTQGELDDAVRLLKNGGFVSEAKIPVVGLLVSAADIGVNQQLHGWGDGRTMFAEVDGAAGLILTPIPGGGMAWSIGTKIGEGASSGIDWLVEAHTGDTPSGHIVTNQLDSRSPGGDWSSLSPDEQARVATEVSQRYEGWSGFKNFLWDASSL
jgi:hypothetical protein